MFLTPYLLACYISPILAAEKQTRSKIWETDGRARKVSKDGIHDLRRKSVCGANNDCQLTIRYFPTLAVTSKPLPLPMLRLFEVNRDEEEVRRQLSTERRKTVIKEDILCWLFNFSDDDDELFKVLAGVPQFPPNIFVPPTTFPLVQHIPN